MLRSRWESPGRFHSSAIIPCAYFSSAGATVLMSVSVCIGWIPLSCAVRLASAHDVVKRAPHAIIIAMNLTGTSQVFLVVAGLLVKLVQVVLDLGLKYFLNPLLRSHFFHCYGNGL